MNCISNNNITHNLFYSFPLKVFFINHKLIKLLGYIRYLEILLTKLMSIMVDLWINKQLPSLNVFLMESRRNNIFGILTVVELLLSIDMATHTLYAFQFFY